MSSSVASRLPAVTERAAMASASSSVDLPEPFSPTRSVTGVSNRSSPRLRIAGMSNGKPVPLPVGARNVARDRWISRQTSRRWNETIATESSVASIAAAAVSLRVIARWAPRGNGSGRVARNGGGGMLRSAMS